MQNDGNWNGRQDPVDRLHHPAAAADDHQRVLRLLVLGQRRTSLHERQHPGGPGGGQGVIPAAPSDLFAMVGALQQNNFMIPSLHMTVTWTGVLGDTTPNLAGLLSASGGASNLYDNFFRILMSGVEDQHVPDPGPYTAPPEDYDVEPRQLHQPERAPHRPGDQSLLQRAALRRDDPDPGVGRERRGGLGLSEGTAGSALAPTGSPPHTPGESAAPGTGCDQNENVF